MSHKAGTSLLLILLLAGFAQAYNWTIPTSASSRCGAGLYHPLSYAYDNDYASYWTCDSLAGNSSYGWGLTYDLLASTKVDGIRVYAWNQGGIGKPCKISSIKLSDDPSFTGASNSLGGDCTFTGDGTITWNTCAIPNATGRYMLVEGGTGNAGSGACTSRPAIQIMDNGYFESQISVAEVTTPALPSNISLGPCKQFSDYILRKNPPYPGSPTTLNTWLIGLTSYAATNMEGELYANNTLTNVQIYTVNGTTSGSDCSGVTAGWLDHIKTLNTVTPHSVLVDYVYGSNSTTTCTVTPPYIFMGFNGTRQGYSYTATATNNYTQSRIYDILADTQKNFHYNITFKYEEDGSNYLLGTNVLVLDVYCGGAYVDYPFKQSASVPSMILQTASPAEIKTTLNGAGQIRAMETEDSLMYNQPLVNLTYNLYQLTLSDYSPGGQWNKSSLIIQTSINNVMTLVNNDSFDNAGGMPFYGKNGTTYRLTLKKDGNVYSIGDVVFNSDNLFKTITVTQPILSFPTVSTKDFNLTWVKDYNNNQVGVVLSSTASMTSTFNVSNASQSIYVPTYASSSSSNLVTYTYLVPNRNIPVFLRVAINHSTLGMLEYTNLILLQNDTMPLNTTAFYPNAPDIIAGVSLKTIKKLFTVLIVLFSIFALCKAYEVGKGLVVGSSVFGFMWYINYVPHNEVPFFIIPTLIFISAMVALFERRVV